MTILLLCTLIQRFSIKCHLFDLMNTNFIINTRDRCGHTKIYIGINKENVMYRTRCRSPRVNVICASKNVPRSLLALGLMNTPVVLGLIGNDLAGIPGEQQGIR